MLAFTRLKRWKKRFAKLKIANICDSSVLLQLAITQSISGTGALRIGAAFLSRFYPHAKKVYVPNPTWGNHIPIFGDSGMQVEKYRYFDKSSNGLDINGMLDDLKVNKQTDKSCGGRSVSLFNLTRLFVFCFIRRMLPRTLSSCFTPVLTTPLVLIPPRNNGMKSLKL